jgi:rhodanese-related sulfurtransferase
MPEGYEEISPRDLKERLDTGEHPVLIDVREPNEYELSRVEGSKLVPLSELPGRIEELDRDAATVVICHHGVRSALAAQFLSASGFREVRSLEGGLDQYSEVDPSVPRY